jgi:2-oxoglutarate dehydrogenase E2 component (dihydrolipoamide succinyltransferase)
MSAEVKVPSVGESVQEGVIFKWHKQNGEFIEMDEVLVELETDKATVEVVSEHSGVVKTLKNEGDPVQVGEIIAQIDTATLKPAGAEPKPEVAKLVTTTAKIEAAGIATPSKLDHKLSPAVNRMVQEHGIDSSRVAGTGRGGRLTKGDVIRHMEAPEVTAKKNQDQAIAKAYEAPSFSGQRTERREPMSLLRRRIAERMLQAQSDAAILTTFNEIDMSAIMAVRKQHKEAFKERHGVNLGFMSFFVKAAVEGIKEIPAINGWVEGHELVFHDYCDIGVAVSAPRGLVVPVVRNCELLDFAGIEKSIANYAQKARDGKITVDEMQGGTFTISNGGVFGSLMSTPILNPPQSGILGMHTIKERPIVVDGKIEIRPMMYVALSYDHRIVDGKEAVTFLMKIKDCIEDPTRLMLGV